MYLKISDNKSWLIQIKKYQWKIIKWYSKILTVNLQVRCRIMSLKMYSWNRISFHLKLTLTARKNYTLIVNWIIIKIKMKKFLVTQILLINRQIQK